MSKRYKCVTLGEISNSNGIQTGPFGSQLKAEEYTEHGIPVVMPKDILHGRLVLDTISQISNEKAKTLKKHQIQEGDIIFPRRGDLRRIGVALKENVGWICGTGCLRARLNDNCYPAFLHQYFQLDVVGKWLERNALGQTMLNLNTEIISNLPINLPPFPEQKAIADLLATWDEAIEKTERLIQAKEQQQTGVIQELINSCCSSWPHTKPSKMFDLISEKNSPGEELLSVTQDRGVIPRSMLEGRVMSPEGTTESYKLIQSGDFVISLRSFQGGIEYSNYRGLISPAYTVLRPKIDLDRDFYRLFFKTTIFIEKYLNLAVIGIRDGKQISIPDFMTIPLPFPEMSDQKKIAGTMLIKQREIDLLKQLAEKYKSQKRGLMQKLLTGQWRVKPEVVKTFE
ncbi:MAG TPA: restriction endonuclease subunit S [Candidatus Rifleibacterium sp.]|jgi:type I restriction enzyme S subunit|nr:restriction endonuclease subunit S [Candidatus Rifleibacterium sp.]